MKTKTLGRYKYCKKKRKLVFRRVLIPLILLVLAIVGSYFAFTIINRPKFVRYAAFGIDIPVNYPIHGIDISHHQSVIDWHEVRKMKVGGVYISFCYIKATEGADDMDDNFRRNWYGAGKSGIIKGAYHFFNPYKNGKDQAKNFISTVKLDKGDLPPVVDIEQEGCVDTLLLQKRLADCLSLIETYYKVKPVIYTNIEFYRGYLNGKFDEYPLWIAHYLAKDKPGIKRNWIFWQHNESGKVNGISEDVDFNVFNGDSLEFRKLLIH